MVNNPPASVGDLVLIPGLVRFHGATKPVCHNPGAHAVELMLHKSAAPTHGNQRKPLHNKDSAHPKIHTYIKYKIIY